SEPEMRVSESELPVNEPERLAANSESGFEEPSVPAFSDSFDAFLPRPEPPSIEPPDAFEPEVQDFRDDDEFEMSEAFGDDEGIEEIAPSFEEDVRIEEVSEDFLKTQPLTKSDLQEISVDTDTGDHDEIEDAALEGLVAAPEIEAPFGLQSDDEEETATEDDTPVFRIEETDEFEPQTEFGSEEKSDSANGEIDPVVNIKGWQSDIPEPDFPQPEGASVLDLDEINLLELPPVDKEESEIEEFDRSNYESGPAYGEVSTIDEYVGEAGEVEPDVAMDADTSDGYGIDADSPSETADELPSNELVESITRRVIEALSEKAIREIAWEVVPDMADLIIKKMAEEKMKK
ncbi:MAG: hypothetical protein OEM82_11420, partial [Acidobacteriota bacterium]|nr:hypothetical protein [Acidobacteriota bacterium]